MPRIVFASKKQNFHELFPRLVEKNKQLYVLPTLVECHFATTSLVLWMLKGGHDILHW